MTYSRRMFALLVFSLGGIGLVKIVSGSYLWATLPTEAEIQEQAGKRAALLRPLLSDPTPIAIGLIEMEIAAGQVRARYQQQSNAASDITSGLWMLALLSILQAERRARLAGTPVDAAPNRPAAR